MICPKCKKENEENAHYCADCGASLVQAPPAPKLVYVPQRGGRCPLSGMAIAGFILALAGVFFSWLIDIFLVSLICGALGLLFSTIAFVKCHKDPLLRGKEMAIIGAGLSAVITVANGISGLLMLLSLSLA